MEKNIKDELNIYLEKLKLNSIKSSWVKKNLPNLFKYLEDKQGEKISEKVFLLENKKGVCKVCEKDVKFLSYERGYRDFCSKNCSNNDTLLKESKLNSFKKTSIENWGVDNPSKSDKVKNKIASSKKYLNYKIINKKAKETWLGKYGVDNPSKFEKIKQKKIHTFIDKWGVDNPFKSDLIKNKIKETNKKKYGFSHHCMSEEIKEKISITNKRKYGKSNFKSSEFDKIGTSIHNSLNSIIEEELYDFIKSIYNGEIIQSYRDGLEIDIYLPSLKLGFEFNGIYWHSEKYKDKWYHLNKTNYFKEKGIRIIHLWEDDWIHKRDILESQIKNWLGLTHNKVFARKCEVREIKDTKITSKFLDRNHIQGKVSSSMKLGLYYKGELVSLMTFDHYEGRKKMNLNEWNVNRFCNKINTTVIGGASKLFKYFLNNYGISRVISYSDNDWSLGSLYKTLGFEKVSEIKPDYKYIFEGKRVHKSRFRKSKTGISESKLDLIKVYDCGKIKWQYLK